MKLRGWCGHVLVSVEPRAVLPGSRDEFVYNFMFITILVSKTPSFPALKSVNELMAALKKHKIRKLFEK